MRIATLAGRPLRLKDSVFLRTKGGASDVLPGLQRQSDALRSREEDLFLQAHGCCLNWERGFDPLIVENQFPIAEGEEVIGVVRLMIGPVIPEECSRHRSRRVSLVMIRRTTNSCQLYKQHARSNFANPLRL